MSYVERSEFDKTSDRINLAHLPNSIPSRKIPGRIEVLGAPAAMF